MDSVVPGPGPVCNPSARLPSNCSLLSEYNVELREYQSEQNQQKHLSSLIINCGDKIYPGERVFWSDYKSLTIQSINWPIAIGISSFSQIFVFAQLSLKRNHNSANHMVSYVFSIRKSDLAPNMNRLLRKTSTQAGSENK